MNECRISGSRIPLTGNRLPRRLTALLPVFLLSAVFCSNLAAETWRFTAAQVSSIQREGVSRTVLDGGSRVESERFLITAGHLELSGENYNLISGYGSLELTDRERNLTVTSGRFEYNRTAKLIRFRDQVTLVDVDEGIVIRCESLDLREDDDLVIMQVAVRLIKDRTVCRGEFATFRLDDNILEISGRPVVWRENDEYRANRIRVDLNTDEIILEGSVAGVLTTQGENDE
jgi:lipopolysaccharide export system protein LptA